MALSFKSIFSSIKTEALPTSSRVVGIDIGSSSIKVIELERTDRAPILRTYGELQLGPYGGKDLGAVVQLDAKPLLESLVDVLRESSVTAKSGVLAVPLSSSFVTIVPIKAGEKESLDARIPVEARKYIPSALSDVTLDWVEVPTTKNGNAGNREVLLVALQNEALAATNILLTQVGMGGQPTELEIFSAIRGTIDSSEGVYSIIDVGAQYSRLYIVREGILVRVHRVAVGGSTITRMLSEKLSLPFEEVEYSKRDNAIATETMAVSADVLSRVMAEFRRAIETYESESGISIEKIVMAGGVSATQGIENLMQDLLTRQIEIAKPFSKVGYPAFMNDVLSTINPSFVNALGAALRQL